MHGLNYHVFIRHLIVDKTLAAFRAAAGRRLLALDPGLNDVGCAADSWRYADGMGRAIQGTGPALHASVKITDCSFFAFQQKTPWGQTFSHMPQPTHASVSSCSVVTPDKYRKDSIIRIALVL